MQSTNQHYLLLYFSGTGNTHWVFERLARALEAGGASCQLLPADKLLADCGLAPNHEADEELLRSRLEEALAGDTTLVLGFPVYESTIPLPIRRLIPLLPDGEGRKLGVVCTYMMAGGDCCHLPEKALIPRGWRSVLATYVKMPNNIKVPAVKWFPIHNGEELAPFEASAGRAVAEIADELTCGREHIEGRGIADYLLGISQRWGEQSVNDYVSNNIFALARCNRCRLCADACPMGAIAFGQGYPEFGAGCCDCLRCYHQCPVSAIQLTAGTMDEQAYPRYRGMGGWKSPRLRRTAKQEAKG